MIDPEFYIGDQVWVVDDNKYGTVVEICTEDEDEDYYIVQFAEVDRLTEYYARELRRVHAK